MSEQQKKFISCEIISSSPQFILSRTIFTEKSISIEQTNVSDFSTFIKKQRNKTFLSSSSNKKIRTVEKKMKCSNYNELNNSNRRHRKEKLNANQTHMFKILQTLSIDEKFKLIINCAARMLRLSIIESQLYQKICRSAN